MQATQRPSEKLKQFHNRLAIAIHQLYHVCNLDHLNFLTTAELEPIYAVQTIDEVMSLLTGMEIGEIDNQGNYPASTLNAVLEQKIQRYSDLKAKLKDSRSTDDKRSLRLHKD